jgi:hypothetical protein
MDATIAPYLPPFAFELAVFLASFAGWHLLRLADLRLSRSLPAGTSLERLVGWPMLIGCALLLTLPQG